MMTLSKKHKIVLAIAVAGIALIGYAAANHDLMDILARLISLVDEKTPPVLFIILMIILPVFGFPLSPFLLVLGMKFGLAAGIALLIIIMPIHMIFSFILAKIAGNFIQSLLSRGSYTIPQVPADKQIRFTFVVACIPVAPYAIKNYLLALAGIPFRIYLSMNWGCQALVAIPSVILGGSIADLNPLLFLAAIAGLIIIYIVVHQIEKKFGKNVDLTLEVK